MIRIALKCLDYQDKTLLTNSVSGSVALQLRLLNSLGYKCVPVGFESSTKRNHQTFFLHQYRFIMMNSSKIQVVNDRAKYIQRKIKEAVSSSSSLDHQLNTSLTTQKSNEDW